MLISIILWLKVSVIINQSQYWITKYNFFIFIINKKLLFDFTKIHQNNLFFITTVSNA